ncbi:MAG: LysE family translocator [Ignavibacteriae bacterium]|nr:MAG: LysE family translocator [Ignavibacteriota bacterium]
MFGIENYWVFILSGIILNLTPGNDTIYILTRSISQGRKAGVVSALGISTGGLAHTIMASLGLSVILSKSIFLFDVIKYTGVIYLVYIGLKTIISKSNPFIHQANFERFIDYKQIYKQGFLTNLFNPKVALFFLSFLPQFINPHVNNTPLPFLLLGLTFLTTGTIWCLFLAYASSFLSILLRENNRVSTIAHKLSGMIFIGLGFKLALEKR